MRVLLASGFPKSFLTVREAGGPRDGPSLFLQDGKEVSPALTNMCSEDDEQRVCCSKKPFALGPINSVFTEHLFAGHLAVAGTEDTIARI